MRKANVRIAIDAETVQRAVTLGGLDLPMDRARALLPLFSALMASWKRLDGVDPDWAGKPVPNA